MFAGMNKATNGVKNAKVKRDINKRLIVGGILLTKPDKNIDK